MRFLVPCLFILLFWALSASSASAQSCFAARSMAEPACFSKRHLKTVTPYPDERLEEKWGTGVLRNKRYCIGGLRSELGLKTCLLGDLSSPRRFALIGDSHSAHWRPAFHVAARRLKVGVVSLVGSGCDFSILGRAPSLDFDMRVCSNFRSRVPVYLSAHPEIKTVFFAQAAYQGPSEQEAYLRAWATLPPSVIRIVTMVDNPRGDDHGYACLRRALSRNLRPGLACAQPRSQVLPPDNAALAAQQIGPPRASVIDLSQFFCDSSLCYPVIGGSLVYAQGSHQAPGFNRTLAPYLLSRLRGLEPLP